MTFYNFTVTRSSYHRRGQAFRSGETAGCSGFGTHLHPGRGWSDEPVNSYTMSDIRGAQGHLPPSSLLAGTP